MNVMKLVALALAAGLVMVGCDSKTEAPATETTTTETVVEQTVAEDADLNTTEDAVETETEVIADENETIN
jgi:predicted component of type VI protein secretion system